MTPFIKGMLARYSERSVFDNPYPWGYATPSGSNAEKWKRGYYKAGRTPYRQLMPTVKIGAPVVAILWLIAEMASFGSGSPEDVASKVCLAEEVTPYYEPFGLNHPDFPEWLTLDKGGMPVEAEDAFIPEYEPERVEEFFDNAPLFSDGLRKTEHPNIKAPAPRFQGSIPGSSGWNRTWESVECVTGISGPGTLPLVLIGGLVGLYFAGRSV